MTNDPTIPHRLKSYLYWKKKQAENPPLYRGFILGESSNLEFVGKFGNPCPFCGDFKQAVNEDGQATYCLCSMTEYLEDLHNDLSDVETIYTSAKLNDLKPLGKYEGAETLRQLKKELAAWVDNPREWFVIMGNPGCGKTHILRALKTYFKQLAFYISCEDLNTAFHKSMRSEEYPLDRLLDDISFVPILLLDDFGIQHDGKGGFFLDTFAQIINRRYNASALEYPTIITTNLGLDDMFGSPNQQMQRVASRIMDENISLRFKLTQPDYRLATTVKS